MPGHAVLLIMEKTQHIALLLVSWTKCQLGKPEGAIRAGGNTILQLWGGHQPNKRLWQAQSQIPCGSHQALEIVFPLRHLPLPLLRRETVELHVLIDLLIQRGQPVQPSMKPALMPAARSTSRETLATRVTPLDRSSRTRTRSTSRCLRSAKATAAAVPWTSRKPKMTRMWAKTSH